jgi:spore germination cell wall hydrolase CwlJ-like protein
MTMTPSLSDAEVRARLTEFGALAITLFGEGRGEPVEGRIAIGSVIRNRVKAPRRFGSSYAAVCHQRAQFSCWWPFGGEPNHALVYAVSRAIVEGRELPLKSPELAIYQECQFIAEGLIGEQLRDRVQGSTHYYAPAAMVPKGRVPDWAVGIEPTVRLGRHLFFARTR